AVLAGVRTAIEELGAPVYDERTGAGWLRYVVVRSSAWTKAAQLVLVVRDRRWPGEHQLLHRLRRLRGVSGVVLNLNPSAGNAVFGEVFVHDAPAAALLERVGGLQLGSHAGAFLQANLGAARRGYERVARWAGVHGDGGAGDLYAGVGALRFYLAGGGRLVVGRRGVGARGPRRQAERSPQRLSQRPLPGGAGGGGDRAGRGAGRTCRRRHAQSAAQRRRPRCPRRHRRGCAAAHRVRLVRALDPG